MPVITPLPTPPSTSDPTNFAERGDAFLGALPQFQEELNEFAEDLNNFSTSATSVTSNTVGTGSKAFTVQTGKGFLPGQSLTIARTAAPTNRMFTVVDSYDSVTGAMVVTSQAFEGAGTFTDWTITLGFNGVVATAQIADGAITENKLNSAVIALFADHITGLTLSTAGSSATMSIAAGVSADSTNAVMMTLASAISKTTSAWAVGTGNGGLDAGTIANNTWYHFYEIRRPDTGVVDVIFSTNASVPTLPTGYTQYAYIESWKTNGSAQWENWYYIDGKIFYKTSAIDASNASVNDVKTLLTVTTPLGIEVVGLFNVFFSNSNTRSVRIYADADTDAALSNDNATLFNSASSNQNNRQVIVKTNTSSQIAWRTSAIANGLYLQTAGYFSKRRNA